MSKVQRQTTISRLIGEHEVTSQPQLIELLAERARLETELSGEKESLAALLRSTYALGKLDTLKLVLAQDQLADTGRLLAYHTQLQRVRLSRITHARELLRSLQQVQLDTKAAKAALAETPETGTVGELFGATGSAMMASRRWDRRRPDMPIPCAMSLPSTAGLRRSSLPCAGGVPKPAPGAMGGSGTAMAVITDF